MKHMFEILVKAGIGFVVFAVVTILVGASYNFVDGEVNKYQARQLEKRVRAEQELRLSMTGNEVLGVQSLIIGEVSEDGEVRTRFERGENVPFIFCREPLTNVVAGVNVRSYYRLEDGVEIQSRQRSLPEGILYENIEDNCPQLTLFADNLPTEDGIYSFCQTVKFTAWGYDKEAFYCSDNTFEINQGE